jgi:glycerate kinase
VTRALRVVVAPDAFKGTIDSSTAGVAFAGGWSEVRPDDVVTALPMADGGEGTMSAIASAVPASRLMDVQVDGPDGRPVDASWLLLPDGTAVVEAATAIGLPLMGRLDARGASSRGLGQLLRTASEHPDVRRVVATIGGVATTDGGVCALEALGARIDDDSVDLSGVIPPAPDGVTCLVDVTAPLLGPLGAARQFGPQKGADADDVEFLEDRLDRWSRALGGDPSLPGAGAAGGLGYGLVNGWGAVLSPGAPAVAELVGLPAAVADADVLVTGEGRLDDQSFQGKVVGHLSSLAASSGVRVVAVAGSCTATSRNGLDSVWELVELAGSLEAAHADPARWLEEAGRAAAAAID